MSRTITISSCSVAGRIVVQAGEELLVHGRDAVGRGHEPVAVGVLADAGEQLLHGLAHALDVHAH